MPFCPGCAHALSPDARFCPACGTPAAPVAAPPTMTAPDITAPASPLLDSSPSSSIHGRFDPGTRLGTRYRIVALLGRGGMGEVYRADDLELGQSVALKFLPETVSHSATDLARFRTEVRVARQIAHPNVCRVYDIGEAEGHVFLSMEYVDGEDLASVLRRMGRPSNDKAIEIARQICLGLAAAHEAGMLHRDLKPANIMIDGRGRVRITDFGLAGLAEDLAREGSVAGTPAYMAPEQLTHGQVSVRSDIYALGLVLYEIFTGRRVFTSTNVNELRQLHETETLTTPTSLVRDLDPVVERVVMRCLDKNPELRPPSAYAVLGGLPGGDPLAAALAAGEMPSPELVANAQDRGTMSPLFAFGCAAVGLVSLALWSALVGPELRQLTQPTSVLAVRATDVLTQTHAFVAPPAFTADGYSFNSKRLENLSKAAADKPRVQDAAFYWRRWSPLQLASPHIHNEQVSENDPPLLAQGQARVLLDPAGHLVGLEAMPPDSVAAAPGGVPDWKPLFTAAGLDMAAFTPAPLPLPRPATCDSAAAWTGTLPWGTHEKVTVQAGASRGRLVQFAIVHAWGNSVSPLRPTPPPSNDVGGWVNWLLNGLVPFVASLFFARRNILLGRGDRKGATRIAVFVFTMNILENAFPARLSETGLLPVLQGWTYGRTLGHAFIHGVTMWFSYIALEPYVRRLWPRMLVSWTRVLSGRLRDPLVGRDLLIGSAGGVTITMLTAALLCVGPRWAGLSWWPLTTGGMLLSASSLGNAGWSMAYGGSVCILDTLTALVYVLVLRLVLRRTWAAVAAVLAIRVGVPLLSGMPTSGTDWILPSVVTLIQNAGMIFLVLRVGLLSNVAANLVLLVLINVAGTLDLSAWYAGPSLMAMGFVVALMLYGMATALAGKSIFGDPLKDAAGR